MPIKFRDTLSAAAWTAEQKKHSARADMLTGTYLKRKSQHIKQPVMDFLFEYYSFRPSLLGRWTPGIGVALETSPDAPLPEISEFVTGNGLAWLNPEFFPDRRLKPARWILKMLKNTRAARPSFSCFGMHEWAMVYKTKDPRHNQVPLRMNSDELAAFVDSRPLLCTHFDAFRFFTPEAAPKNRYRPTRENFEHMEQPGCIHTNMDLYKWAYKLYPWINSSLILEAFELAVAARTIDMQASPYDLSGQGLAPIKIETEEGRAEYKEKQKEISERGIMVRDKLIAEYEYFFEALEAAALPEMQP